MAGCSYCSLNGDNQEECLVCIASYILVLPQSRCIRELNVLEQKNCQVLGEDGKCESCDFGYYFSSDGCVRNPDIEYTLDVLMYRQTA